MFFITYTVQYIMSVIWNWSSHVRIKSENIWLEAAEKHLRPRTVAHEFSLDAKDVAVNLKMDFSNPFFIPHFLDSAVL